MCVGISERVVDVLEVNGALGITEASESGVYGDIESETVACDPMEFLYNLSCLRVEALGAHGLVAAASDDEVLVGDEANGVHDWVQNVIGRCDIPDHLLNGALKVTEVPDLDAFPESATTCHDVVVIL